MVEGNRLSNGGCGVNVIYATDPAINNIIKHIEWNKIKIKNNFQIKSNYQTNIPAALMST